MSFAHHIFFCELIVAKQPPVIERRKGLLKSVGGMFKPEANKVKVEESAKAVQRVEGADEEEEDEWEYQDENDIYLRSKFFESWLWRTVDLPARPDKDG